MSAQRGEYETDTDGHPRGDETQEAAGESVEREERADTDPIPLSQAFHILSNARRRLVLRVLRDRGERVSLGEVSEIIAAWENDKEVANLSSSERKRVYVGLYQCHLPKMDDCGVLNFDKPRGTIELGENASAVFEYLDQESEKTRPWAAYYLGLTAFWGVVFVAGLVGSVAALSSPFVIALQLLTFSACAVVHYRARDRKASEATFDDAL